LYARRNTDYCFCTDISGNRYLIPFALYLKILFIVILLVARSNCHYRN
jgi:hypothetical protein